jgi:hypothetical protein
MRERRIGLGCPHCRRPNPLSSTTPPVSRPVAALLCAFAIFLAAPAAANAAFTITPSTTQAGAPAQVAIHADFAANPDSVTLHLPPGLVGNPGPFTPCTESQFQSDSCPSASQVGTASANGGLATGEVYNLVPHADEPARLGIRVAALLILPARNEASVTLRPDGGLDSTIASLQSVGGQAITSLDLTLDSAFMTMPTSCATATARIEAPPNAEQSASFTPTNCAAVPFTPGAGIAVADPARTKPSAYAVTLTVPDGGNPRQSHVRRAQVTLPLGTTLSPGVATGLVACSAAQFAGSGCPAASQIGTVSFATPLIGTLAGKVFFGTPANGRYPTLVAVDDHGVHLHLTGTVTLDQRTGQISTVFDDLPPVPFTSFTLSFQGGDKAVLANPPTCGTKTLTATLTPWSGNAAKTATASFTTTGCPAGGIPFRPTLSVASGSTAAGRPAGALSITIARPDGDQDISRVETQLPPGLAASLSGVPFCGEADANAGTCPDATRLGSVTALVGTGGAPVTLTGGVFLTGPAEGGLAGLAIVLPGRVGPVDLGTVVTRAGLLLRPSDGGVTVRTAPLPQIVGGVPVSIRSLTLRLDRPGFTVNPSSCATQTVAANLTAAGGATATATAPYTATDCGGLPFAPRLAATIDARGPAGARTQPALRTVITIPPGNASTSETSVALPSRLGILAAAIRGVCLVAQQAADACPANSQVGTVTAETPLLPVPLSGPVYVEERPGELLPGLRLALGGPVQLRLDGSLQQGPTGLVSVFRGIPDVPLSRLELTFTAGGPLQVIGNPCTGALMHATGSLTGHNGAHATAPARVKVSGCPALGRATLGKGRRPGLTLALHHGRDAGTLTAVRVTLPVRATRLRARADGKRRAIRVHGRTVTIRLHGARDVTLHGRLASRTGRAIRVAITRTGNKHATLRLRPVR